MAAGICGCFGLGALYRGMAVGAMAIVAPVSAVSAVIPFTVGVVSGERPGALQLVGILLALAGVALASREPAERGGGRAAGVGLALVAALGFGLYFVFLDHAADESVPWAVTTARGTSSLIAVAVALGVGAVAAARPGPSAGARRRRPLRRRRERPLRARLDEGSSASCPCSRRSTRSSRSRLAALVLLTSGSRRRSGSASRAHSPALR